MFDCHPEDMFDSRDEARKAMVRKGLNTSWYYKKNFDIDDFKVSVSDSFYHIATNDGAQWDKYDIVELELK